MTTQTLSEVAPQDPSLQVIMSERRRLIAVAYRLLGSVADAEDVVQETYVRWFAMPPEQRETIETPGAWLTKVASRICLDVLGRRGSGGRATSASGCRSPCPGARTGSTAGGTAPRRPG